LNISRKVLLALLLLLLLLGDVVVSSASISDINSVLLSVHESIKLIRGSIARTLSVEEVVLLGSANCVESIPTISNY
jgi:hypothetical protein